MANALKLYCGVFGAAIVFPVSLLGIISAVASPLSQGSVPRTVVVIIMSLLTTVGSLASIGFTILNTAAPENPHKKVTGIIVLVSGVLAVAPFIIMMASSKSTGFVVFLCFVMVSVAGQIFSGLLQAGIVKLK